MILQWDEYFLGVAKLSSLRSKDPNTKVGACIVNKSLRIVGIGYNGFPKGCGDDIYPWESNEDYVDSKYAYVVHAELNAILNSSGSLEECSIYVTHFPCNECAKAIIQSGITEVVYESDKHKDSPNTAASKKMLDSAGVAIRRIDLRSITI